MWRRLTDEDKQQDEGWDPRILLPLVDDGVAKDGDHVRDDCDNYNANSDGHGVVRHCTENLPHHDEIDNEEATSDDDVKYRAEFGTPETERVTGGGNCTESKLTPWSVYSWSVTSVDGSWVDKAEATGDEIAPVSCLDMQRPSGRKG